MIRRSVIISTVATSICPVNVMLLLFRLLLIVSKDNIKLTFSLLSLRCLKMETYAQNSKSVIDTRAEDMTICRIFPVSMSLLGNFW